jgi:hypothetical protein
MVNDENDAQKRAKCASVTVVSRMSAELEHAQEGSAYRYRPSLLGAAWEFTLGERGIDWSAGRKSGHIPYGKVRRLRLSFRPVSMQSYRFSTELWAEDGTRLQIASSSWKTMMEQERLDRPYSAFVRELHRRLADAGAPVRYERGKSPWQFWPGFTVFAGVAVGLTILFVRALQADAKGGAAFIGIFTLLFFWQGGNFLRRNRPGLYAPGSPPAELMPN